MTLEPQGGPPDDVRISDEERTQVVDRLRRHCAEGRITLDEFSDRAGQVYAARTPVSWSRCSPTCPSRSHPSPTKRWRCAGIRPAGWSASWAAVRARVAGGQTSEVTALAIMGGCVLDLRQAEIEGRSIDISAIAIMGGVEVIVPEGIAVEMSGVAIMGGKDCRVKDVTPLPGTPIVSRVNAFAFWGGVTVRTKREGIAACTAASTGPTPALHE